MENADNRLKRGCGNKTRKIIPGITEFDNFTNFCQNSLRVRPVLEKKLRLNISDNIVMMILLLVVSRSDVTHMYIETNSSLVCCGRTAWFQAQYFMYSVYHS